MTAAMEIYKEIIYTIINITYDVYYINNTAHQLKRHS